MESIGARDGLLGSTSFRRLHPAYGGDNERLDRGIGKGRNAADIDFAEHVALLSRDRRFAVQEIAVPQQGKLIRSDIESALQLRNPFRLQACLQAVQV